MGKKRRGGVSWSVDPTSGSPRGEGAIEWDGRSRTGKRNRVKQVLEERKLLIDEIISLHPDKRAIGVDQVREHLREVRGDEESLGDALIDQLEQLSEMKRSGAKQRLIKHLCNTLDEEEWDALFELKRVVEESKGP